MKLHYLANVQRLLENYDFQDKYKVMLDLEKTLSKMEHDGHIDQLTLLNTLGTPAQFVEDIVEKYNLSLISNVASSIPSNGLNTNIQQNPSSEPLIPNVNNQISQHQQQDNEAQRYEERQAQSHIQDRNPYNDNCQPQDKRFYNNKEPEKKREQNNGESIAAKTVKAPFKIFFLIITWIFFLLALFILTIGVIVSVIVLVLVDIQTALTLILGVLFFLITILLSINFIKNSVFSIIERKVNISKLSITLIFIIVFAILSKIMLLSVVDTVNLYIIDNLSDVMLMFSSHSIDTSNIDWEHMDLGQYLKLIGNSIKAAF